MRPADVVEALTCAGLGVIAAIRQPVDPSQHQGPCTHGARPQCHVDGAVLEAPGLQGCGGLDMASDSIRPPESITHALARIRSGGAFLVGHNRDHAGVPAVRSEGVRRNGRPGSDSRRSQHSPLNQSPASQAR